MRLSGKLRKVCAVLLCTAFVASGTGFAGLEVHSADEEKYTVIWDTDFEGSTDIKTFVSSKYQEVTIGTDVGTANNNYIKIVKSSSSQWPQFEKNFDSVTDGILYVGYDLAREESGRFYDGYLEEQSGDGWNEGFLFVGTVRPGSGNNNISYYTNMHVSGSIPTGLEVTESTAELKSWQRVDSWIDLDERIATYYLDGTEIGKTEISDELEQIVRYRRKGQNGGTGTEYLDNYKIIHFKGISDDMKTTAEAEGIPKYLTEAATVSLSAEALGNNYFEDYAELTFTVKNAQKEPLTGTISVNVTDDGGNAVSRINQTVTVPGKSSVTEKITVMMPYFGFYNVVAGFGNESYTAEAVATRLVRLRKSKEQNQQLGYSAHSWWNYGTDEIVRKLDLFEKAGFKYAREPIYRNNDEYEINYNWNANRTWNALDNSDIEQVVLIDSLTYDKYWGSYLPTTDAEKEDFYSYMYNLARELKGKVTYWEFLNEPEWQIYSGLNLVEQALQGSEIAKNYVAAQEIFYNAINDAYEGSEREPVVLCGATVRVPEKWIKLLLDNGAGEYFDAYSFHPYSNAAAPETAYKYTEDTSAATAAERVEKLRTLLNSYDLSNKGIVVTELAYSSAYDMTNKPFNCVNNEFDQAAYGIRQYITVRPSVELFTWYNDQNKGTTASVEDNFGLIRNWNETDGVAYQAKPVLLAFSAFNSIVGNAEDKGKVSVTDSDVWIYRYEKADGTDVLAVWNKTDAETTINLELGANEAVLSDMYGNPKALTSGNGIYSFSISGNVSYLEGNFDNDIALTSTVGTCVDNVRLVDRYNGYDTPNFSDAGRLALEAEIANNTADDKNCLIIWASYNKEGHLQESGVQPVSASAGGSTKLSGEDKIQLNLTKPDEAETVKAFLWTNTADGLQPLCASCSSKRISGK